jgi:hypothetical protein
MWWVDVRRGPRNRRGWSVVAGRCRKRDGTCISETRFYPRPSDPEPLCVIDVAELQFPEEIRSGLGDISVLGLGDRQL